MVDLGVVSFVKWRPDHLGVAALAMSRNVKVSLSLSSAMLRSNSSNSPSSAKSSCISGSSMVISPTSIRRRLKVGWIDGWIGLWKPGGKKNEESPALFSLSSLEYGEPAKGSKSERTLWRGRLGSIRHKMNRK